jgi:hypothetical protein
MDRERQNPDPNAMRTYALIPLFVCLGSALFAQNQTLQLDGAGDFLYVTNDASLTMVDEVSVSAWIRFNSLGGAVSIARQGGTNTPAYSLNKEVSGYFVFFVYVNGSWQNTGYTALTSPVPGQWYHVAGTYDGAALKLYVNGMLENSQAVSGAITNSTDIFSVGCDVAPFGSYVDGAMDEVSVWNKALQPAQIATVMADTLGPAYYTSADSGLVAYWRFDVLEDLGINNDGVDDVRDLSVHGNHGDLMADATLGPENGPLSIADATRPGFFLDQNLPNPAEGATRIRYGIPGAAVVRLRILDVWGREVRKLVDGLQPAGTHWVEWDGAGLPPATYFIQLRSGASRITRKVMLVRP